MRRLFNKELSRVLWKDGYKPGFVEALQCSISMYFPQHDEASPLMQSRNRFLVPLAQVLEHFDHDVHGDQKAEAVF